MTPPRNQIVNGHEFGIAMVERTLIHVQMSDSGSGTSACFQEIVMFVSTASISTLIQASMRYLWTRSNFLLHLSEFNRFPAMFLTIFHDKTIASASFILEFRVWV